MQFNLKFNSGPSLSSHFNYYYYYFLRTKDCFVRNIVKYCFNDMSCFYDKGLSQNCHKGAERHIVCLQQIETIFITQFIVLLVLISHIFRDYFHMVTINTQMFLECL